MAVQVKNLKVKRQHESSRALYATWDKLSGSNYTNQENFEYRWRYCSETKNGKHIWFEGDPGTSERDTPSCTYTPPEEAYLAQVNVQPVAKTKKNSDSKYYTSDWCKKWVTYEYSKHPIPIHSVSNFTISGPVGTTYTATWQDLDYGWPNDIVSGYEYQWEYFNGRVMVQGDSGTVDTPSPYDPTTYGCDYEVPEDAEEILISVTPIPTAEYLFSGQTKRRNLYITKETRQVKNLTLTLLADGSIRGLWQIDDVTLLASFNCEWSYWLNDIWTTESARTVQIEDKAYGDGKHRSWGNVYSPPAGATVVRLKVLPVGDTGSSAFYIEEALSDKYYFDIAPKTVDKTTITATKVPNTARTYLIEWGLIDYTNVSSFDCEIRYRMNPGGSTYLPGKSESINVNPYGRKDSRSMEITEKDNSGKTVSVIKNVTCYIWGTTYDVPDNAAAIHVRIKCNPTYENAFSSVWSEEAAFTITTPTKEVTSIAMDWYEQATQTLQAIITMDSVSGVASFSATWLYWHVSQNGTGSWIEDQTDTVTITSRTGITRYTVPEDAYSHKVKVRVEPTPSVSGSFIPNPKSQKFEWNVPEISVPKSALSIFIQEDTDRSMVGRWDLSGIANYISSTDYIEYQWAYKIGNDYRYESPESVNELAQRVSDLYEAPAGTKQLAFRVRPVPTSANFYVGGWSEWVYYNFSIPLRMVSDISVSLQRGSDSTIVCTWDIANEANVDSYSYEWRHQIDEVWYDGKAGSATVRTPSCDYDAPVNATLVAVRIIPVPQYSTSFLGKWSEEVKFAVPAIHTPADGPTPTVSVSGLNLTAQVDIYDEHTNSVEFEIVTETKSWKKATINVLLNRATWVVSISPGTTYRVRCRGINQYGEQGEWSQYSSEVYGPPTAPTIKSCKASSATSITVEWTALNANQHVTEYTVEYVINSKAYFDTNPSAITSITISSGTVAEILDLSTAGTYFFRVKASNDSQGGDSTWSAIKDCILGTVPSAPTTWSSTTTATTDRDIFLYWIHNSEDNSTETSAILEITANGSTTTHTITNTSGSENYTGSYRITAGTYAAGATIQWRVKTKGVVDSYGEYSTMRVVYIYAPPTLGMEIRQGDDEALVDGAVRTFPIKLNLTAGPSTQTPVSYYIVIKANNSYIGSTAIGLAVPISNGSTIFSRYIASSDPDYVALINAEDVILEMGNSYTIVVTCTMNSGLVSEVSQIIDVAWDYEGVDLNAEYEYDRDSATMALRPYCENEYGVIIDDVALSVYRREFDGSFTEIATSIPNSNRQISIIDPHPALDYARYRLTARSNTTGRIFFEDLPPIPIKEYSIIIQWDEEWQTFDGYPSFDQELWEKPYSGSMVKLPYNIDTNESNTLDVELINYIGRRNPVSYYGTQVGQTASWSTDIAATDIETIYALRRLAVYMGDVYVREPSGTGYWANIKVSFGIKHIDTVIPVSLEITRVEGGA